MLILTMIIIQTSSIFAYLVALISQYLVISNTFKQKNRLKWVILLSGFLAIILHAYLLYRWIDLAEGQNLYFLNILSVMAWLSSGLLLVSSWRKPIGNLILFIFPLSMISIFAVMLFPGQNIVQTGKHPQQLIHILLSILAFSVLCIAALQTGLVALQNYLLRNKRVTGFVRFLPSYECMESFLFEIIGFGFILFSVVLFSSMIWLASGGIAGWKHVAYLFILAWLVFVILLWGRYKQGWSGWRAIRCTGIGMFVLAIAYGSHWVLF